MAEELNIVQGSKEQQYLELIPQIEALISIETDLVANLANISAALKEQFNWLWVGFYLVKEDELVLGPFQGPIACTRIQKGKGVCGTVWSKAKTIVVDNVHEFPGHIACSSHSQSEIVIPIMKENIVIGVLDIDSSSLSSFDNVDKKFLEKLVKLIN